MDTVLANEQMTGSKGGNTFTPTAPSVQQTKIALSADETQYDKATSDFFRIFNEYTKRPLLYYGYMAGALEECAATKSKKRIAIDYGCGTGWLTRQLATLNFTRVHGIDTSPNMRKLAFSETPNNYIQGGVVTYSHSIPESVIGKCSLVTAVHVHYHFKPLDELRRNYFGAIASALEIGGSAIIVGCPSNYVQATPDHYQNCVHVSDVPKEILEIASDPEILQDDGGYIGLSCLPRYGLKDGTQMKVTFNAHDKEGKPHTATLFDTFWKDATLIKTAAECGLELIKHTNLSYDNHPNAYMMMSFRKTRNIPTPQQISPAP